MLVRACHPGPTLAVTMLTVLLGAAADLRPGRLGVLGLAVLAGQLTIGWSNDLVDAERDAAVGRTDKPLATGRLGVGTVRAALVVALAACAVGSFALGPAAGSAHLILVVGSGWVYNVGLKSTIASFVPYAVAFGALPVVVQLSAVPPVVPPVWMMITGATLGTAAHLVNALPDLIDDAATAVAGLPHRLGSLRSRAVATVLLLGGTVVSIVGPGTAPPVWVWTALVIICALTALIMIGRGATPFRTALAVALIDVVVLVQRSRGAV